MGWVMVNYISIQIESLTRASTSELSSPSADATAFFQNIWVESYV